MPRPKGMNGHKADATMCMAVGCERKALYRSTHGQRGYCGQHRDVAVARMVVQLRFDTVWPERWVRGLA